MIYFKLVGGSTPDLKNHKQSDEYATKVLNSLYDIEKAKSFFKQSVEIFNESNLTWINRLHRSKYAMKDVSEFSELILKTIDNAPLNSLIDKINQQQQERIGIVARAFYSQGRPFAYIRCGKEEFFMSGSKNKGLNFNKLKGKRVSFILSLKDGKERVQALNVKILDNE